MQVGEKCMIKFVSNLILNLIFISLIGLVFIWSYKNLISNINQNLQKEENYYISQNQAIKDIQFKHFNVLTMQAVLDYDKQNRATLSSALEKSNELILSQTQAAVAYSPPKNQLTEPDFIREKLDLVQQYNSQKIAEIDNKKNNFWNYLPPSKALILGGYRDFSYGNNYQFWQLLF